MTPNTERRDTTRPRPGDTRLCPRCGRATVFREYLRITNRGIAVVKAAWTCSNAACLFEYVLREE